MADVDTASGVSEEKQFEINCTADFNLISTIHLFFNIRMEFIQDAL